MGLVIYPFWREFVLAIVFGLPRQDGWRETIYHVLTMAHIHLYNNNSNIIITIIVTIIIRIMITIIITMITTLIIILITIITITIITINIYIYTWLYMCVRTISIICNIYIYIYTEKKKTWSSAKHDRSSTLNVTQIPSFSDLGTSPSHWACASKTDSGWGLKRQKWMLP